MTYGVNSTGFNRKTNDVLTSEIQAKVTDKLGITNFTNLSIVSIFTNILIVLFTEVWETLEGVYHLMSPDNAFGLNQDNLFALVNVPRLQPRKSTVVLTLTNTNTSDLIIPSGQIVKQSANNVQWFTIEEVTIPASSTITCNAESEFYGAYTASVDTIDTIVTPVAGWSSVTNLSEALQGQAYETTSEYRLRKEKVLSTSQGGILSSVIARIRNEIDGVTYITGHENYTENTLITDEITIPPHSIALTIVGGDDNAIAQLLGEIKGNGINTVGDESFDIITSQGTALTVRFSRANIIDIYVTYELTVTSSYDIGFNEAIKDNVVDFSNNLNEGKDIVRWQLESLVPFGLEVNALPIANNDSLIDVSVKFGTSASPTTNTKIELLHNEKARILRSNIVINTTVV